MLISQLYIKHLCCRNVILVRVNKVTRRMPNSIYLSAFQPSVPCQLGHQLIAFYTLLRLGLVIELRFIEDP
jgi:hypothetical protein